ncbi:MgtC/SapB family protein [Acidovorax soli]|uniref:MgtC/SapB family protein n=1 Tax=Acidovorax TaxID=12916 RepID=UPI0026F0AC2A|nr:MgtC/SapB family protein [Acidovorax soli]MCM2345308.1 MgtC/SapB family protein [Acidovorax soli]
MQDLAGFSTALAVLASATGCGLLMGIERERRKGEGPGRAPAGVRSFTLASIGGAAAALTGMEALVVVGAALVAALTVVAYARDRSGDPGVTTEIALLLAYLIGVTCARDQLLAAALAVVVTGLLALRDALHQFSSQWLQPGEVRSGLILAALALLVYPLAPDTPLWQGALNPRLVVRLVIVLLVIQSLAHVAKRLMQARHALALSALASGFVSSTATIASLGMEVRAGQATPRVHGAAAVLSCVATMVQIVVVAATVQPQWLARLWLPALAGGCVAAALGWWGGRGVAHRQVPAPAAEGEAVAGMLPDTPMFKLRDALLIAALLTGIQVGMQLLTAWQGDAGMLAGALLAALADVHAATAAVLVRGGPDSVAAPAIASALMVALLVHAGSKSAVALASGGWRYALAVAPGILAHTLAFVGVLALQ